MLKNILTSSLCILGTLSVAQAAKLNSAEYCINQGGKVETMVAEYGSGDDVQYGFNKKFCTFEIDGGFIAVGLETFSSKKSNIAATYITQLKPLKKYSPLWDGKYSNPSLNVCKNLGGAEIAFNAVSGGFTNNLGQSDICVFGDGSMVSAWSLIYMANGRDGYNKVKESIRSEPLNINMPR